MSINVAYDISAGLAQGGGIGRYTRELALAINELATSADLRLSLYSNRQSWARLPSALAAVPRKTAPFGDKLWRLWLLAGAPLPSVADGCDVLHGADVIIPRSRTPAVITIYDLTPVRFPQFHTRLNGAYLRLAFPIMARRADAVIAISESTRADVVNMLGIAPSKVHRVYPGINTRHFSTIPVAEARAKVKDVLGYSDAYLLALGTLEPRKNLATLLQAYAKLPADTPHLVLAGAQGWGEAGLSDTIDRLGIRQRVHMPGRVPDETLSALYTAAEVFVYPSYFEGFGLPVLEAMACGAPVITSNCSSLPEVAGEAAILIDPADSDALAAALMLVMNSPELRNRMRTLGHEQALKFSWKRSAQETIALYELVAGTVRR